MKNKISLILILFSCISFAKSNCDKLLEDYSQVNINRQWELRETENSLTFSLTDTMGLVSGHLSPVWFDSKNDPNELNTYELIISVESNWTMQLYEDVYSQNNLIIDSLRQRVLSYYDSTNWYVKVSRRTVELNPNKYFHLVKNWSSEELALIDELRELPNTIVDGCGVYYKSNAVGIINFKQSKWLVELISQLTTKGLRFANINWRDPNYTYHYQTILSESKMIYSRGIYGPYILLHTYIWDIESGANESLFSTEEGGVIFRSDFMAEVLDTLKLFVEEFNLQKNNPEYNTISIVIFNNDTETTAIQKCEYLFEALKKLKINTNKMEVELKKGAYTKGMEPYFIIRGYYRF